MPRLIHEEITKDKIIRIYQYVSNGKVICFKHEEEIKKQCKEK